MMMLEDALHATTLARPVPPERWGERIDRWNVRHGGDEVMLELTLLRHAPRPPQPVRLDRIVYDALARSVELRIGPVRSGSCLIHPGMRVRSLEELISIDDASGDAVAIRLGARHIRILITRPNVARGPIPVLV